MAISSAPLNSDSIDTQTALQRKGSVQSLAGAASKTEGSYVTHISAAGQAMLALDNFQTYAEKIQTTSSFRTPRYLQNMVEGVVESLNTLRGWLSAAASVKSRYTASSAKTLEAIDKAVTSNEANLAALKRLGVERKADGSFAVNPAQVVKAYGDNPENAFATVVGFAASVSKAPDVQPLTQRREEENARAQSAQAQSEDATVTIDFALQQRLAAALAEAGTFSSRKAVYLYQTVESI
jgi:hypothetical protein